MVQRVMVVVDRWRDGVLVAHRLLAGGGAVKPAIIDLGSSQGLERRSSLVLVSIRPIELRADPTNSLGCCRDRIAVPEMRSMDIELEKWIWGRASGE